MTDKITELLKRLSFYLFEAQSKIENSIQMEKSLEQEIQNAKESCYELEKCTKELSKYTLDRI